MKNISLILLACLFAFNVQAQDNGDVLTGKKGQPILPEAGDIGLGVNLIPLFNWFGNSFNNNSNNTYAGANKFFTTFGNSVVMGKYMLSESTALRVNFGLSFSHYEDNKHVFDDAANDPNVTVLDTRVSDNSRFTLGIGYEMRRGKGRIQGYYGADIAFIVNKFSGNTYQYGNALTSTNITPTAYNWGSNLNGLERTIQDGVSAQFGVGLRPFIGVEYFVAPKISLGCEFGYALMYMHTFESKTISEYYEAPTGNVVNNVTIEGAKNQFSGGIDNFNGAIFMMFYF